MFFPRTPVSCVIKTLHLESFIRSLVSHLKMLQILLSALLRFLHASIAIDNSGTICIYKQTRSPFLTQRL
ncbi:MAG: hypothetical protein CM15mP4_2990 [Candidatus Neomarinimicrobiota bacterium]|nr:MAG: hypothetical protein CM15mP4_2990 [Candidatus Neomarinimicrobiota bacterium]